MREGGCQKTAVFICELRSDLGFAAPLLCVADELVRIAAQQGSQLRTIFVLSDPVYYGHEVAARGHMVLPAPVINRQFEINSLGRSYADLLAAIGFARERELKMLVETWDRLFALLSADVVIADNCPLACLAARGRIPVYVAGSGFSAPPASMAFFPAIAGIGQAETNQSLLVDTVNGILHGRGLPHIDNLPELFAGEQRAVFSVPHLDPYHAHRDERLLSPCCNIKGPLAPREAPSIFFSLPSTFPDLARFVRALKRVGAVMSCYVPGPGTVGSTLLRETGARIFETRPVLHDVLSDATVVLATSADLASSAYLAGRPQVILRGDLETNAMASELENRHTAIALDAADLNDLTDAIRELLNNPSYAQSAREESRRLQTMGLSDNSAATAARECLGLIESSRAASSLFGCDQIA
jgi:UDP:flavonoid glycosyltransferase YjiC (YdhE family)